MSLQIFEMMDAKARQDCIKEIDLLKVKLINQNTFLKGFPALFFVKNRRTRTKVQPTFKCLFDTCLKHVHRYRWFDAFAHAITLGSVVLVLDCRRLLKGTWKQPFFSSLSSAAAESPQYHQIPRLLYWRQWAQHCSGAGGRWRSVPDDKGQELPQSALRLTQMKQVHRYCMQTSGPNSADVTSRNENTC